MKVKFAGRKGAELLLADLKKRFPPNVRLSAFAVLQPGFWFRNRAVADDEDSRAEFIKSGKKKFDVLVGRYGALNVQVGVEHIPAIIDASNANAEWDSLEVLMESCMRFPSDACPTTAEFWKSHLQNDAITARMPEIVKLVRIMLLAPTGSVENERSFSDMNFLKDDKRNSLGEDHLNDSMHGWRCRFGVNDFPYEAALGAWMAHPRRMVNM